MPQSAPNIPKDIKRQELIQHREKIHDLTMAQLVIYFQNRKSFYAHAIAELPKLPSLSCPTMQIRLHRNRYLFEYHPEWYKYLSENEACTVIEHECLHVILGHIPRFNQLLASATDDMQRKIMCMVANVAMDLAVNTIIAQYSRNALPEGILLPENFDLEPMKTFDFYLVELMNRVKIQKVNINIVSDDDGDEQEDGDGGQQQPGGGSGDDDEITLNVKVKSKKGGKNQGDSDEEEEGEDQDGDGENDQQDGENDQQDGQGSMPDITLGDPQLDEHMKDSNTQHPFEYDKDSDLEPDEIEDSLEDQSKKMVKTAVEQIKKLYGDKGRGIIPGCFSELIELNEKIIAPRVWERKILGKIKQTKMASEEFRINRFNYSRSTLGHNIGLFGTREDIDMFRILAMVDTSGSMSEDDIAAVLAVPQSLMRCEGDIEMKVIEFDCHIQKRYLVKKNGSVEVEVLGRGGTDFDPPFKEAFDGCDPDGNVFKPDLILVCTDGGAPPPREEYRVNLNTCPVVWAIVENYFSRHPCPGYGDEVRVKPER